jgi:hypothetical protein
VTDTLVAGLGSLTAMAAGHQHPEQRERNRLTGREAESGERVDRDDKRRDRRGTPGVLCRRCTAIS